MPPKSAPAMASSSKAPILIQHCRQERRPPSSSGSDRKPSRLAAAPTAPGLSGLLSHLRCFCALRAGTARGPSLRQPWPPPRVSDFGFPSAFGLRLSGFPAALAMLLGLLTFTPSGFAQPASPHIGYVYPAGGRQGAV